jgi:copper chaperone CopZ
MKTTITVADMSCGDCADTIKEALEDITGVRNVTPNDDAIEVSHDESVSPETLVQAVKKAGYDAELVDLRPAQCEKNKHLGKIMQDRAVNYAIAAFLTLFVLEAFAYVGFFSKIPDFLTNYGWWILYLNVSVATLGAAAWYIHANKTAIGHMTGMMIGMTVGMQSSMLLGAIVGATNGFFIGSVVGVLTGITAGSIAGRCCGVMGVMEGMMAGLMGGTMGPMITVMMLTDNVLWFMPLYIIVNVIILGGLMHMYFQHVIAKARTLEERPLDAVTFVSLCVIITSVLIAIMVYGPKSVLFGG